MFVFYTLTLDLCSVSDDTQSSDIRYGSWEGKNGMRASLVDTFVSLARWRQADQAVVAVGIVSRYPLSAA